jgi:D-proline reductase (dithiol) PrdB
MNEKVRRATKNMASPAYRPSKQEERVIQNGYPKPIRSGWLSKLIGSWITLPGTEHEFTGEHGGPARTRAGRLNELWARWFSNTELGGRFARWISRTISLPQLRRLTDEKIPWTPLRKPLSECTVVILTTGGVHLRSDKPFNLNSDPTFRVIPRNARPDELAISHQAYDRTDALKDINLVFPIDRLRELEAKHVIGRLADEHYGFGLEGSAQKLTPSIKEVAQRIRQAGVDLALLVPA